MAKKCRHPACYGLKTPLRLVKDCHRELPELDLTVKVQDQTYYVRADNYSISDCCDLRAKNFVKGDITFYGQGAALDMLIKEKDETEASDFGEILRSTQREWREFFFSEMYLLLDIEQNPQERNGERRENYLDQALDAAEQRHLDRM